MGLNAIVIQWPRYLDREKLEAYADGPVPARILIERGLKPAIKAPKCVRFDRKEVDALMDAILLDRGIQ